MNHSSWGKIIGLSFLRCWTSRPNYIIQQNAMYHRFTACLFVCYYFRSTDEYWINHLIVVLGLWHTFIIGLNLAFILMYFMCLFNDIINTMNLFPNMNNWTLLVIYIYCGFLFYPASNFSLSWNLEVTNHLGFAFHSLYLFIFMFLHTYIQYYVTKINLWCCVYFLLIFSQYNIPLWKHTTLYLSVLLSTVIWVVARWGQLLDRALKASLLVEFMCEARSWYNHPELVEEAV